MQVECAEEDPLSSSDSSSDCIMDPVGFFFFLLNFLSICMCFIRKEKLREMIKMLKVGGHPCRVLSDPS